MKRAQRAHPRSRGENSSEAGDEKGATGSSPLTRGKRVPSVTSPDEQRLIPAHAGKTRSAEVRAASSAAHPRSRGENLGGIGDETEVAGSSPLTRGKPKCCNSNDKRAGLIPAHAGKTLG